MLPTRSYAVSHAEAPLAPLQIERREPGANDVLVKILFCGVCHSDVSFARGHFPGVHFPLVPGHEIVGEVERMGAAVTRHAMGDIVGIGTLVDSCRRCDECSAGLEQFCDLRTQTYGSLDSDGKTPTYGGYSSRITVDENFALKVPKKLSPAAAAPLLCAGITTYSPLRHFRVGKGSRVAVVGLGGLGHVAVKLASAMGAHVTVLSRSGTKRADALRLGASDFGVTSDTATFQKMANRFDVIINTVSGEIDTDAHISLLRRDGVLVFLGVPRGPLTVNPFGLLLKRKSVSASIVGGIKETQEMLEFCADHSIEPDIEIIGMDQINEAWERVVKSDVRYRFVIDMSTLE